MIRLVPDWSGGRHRLSKPIRDWSQAKPMPMTISMTTFDTQLKISFIVYNITIRRLVLKEFWTRLMHKALDTDAVLHYSLGLIWRVVFLWLSRHSRSLFSVLVSLCPKIETVCDKKWLNEYENLSPTPKNVVKKSNIIEFKRKLIHLHVARNLCLISVQQKTHMRLFMTFFMTGAMDLIANCCFRNEPILRSGILFSRGRGEREWATVVFPSHLPSPPSTHLIQAK